jgi:hypothetical protein
MRLRELYEGLKAMQIRQLRGDVELAATGGGIGLTSDGLRVALARRGGEVVVAEWARR